MNRLVKYLGVFFLVFSFVGPASASTLEEYFTFTYSSTGGFTLKDLSYSPTTGGSNLLTGIYTTSGGGHVGAGSGSISQIVFVDSTKSYSSDFSISHLSGPGTFSTSVSPVPLPAGFPLFALALGALGFVAYRAARDRKAGLQLA